MRLRFPTISAQTVSNCNGLYKGASFDAARAKLISNFCNGLLSYFNHVIAVDVDEILVAGENHDFSLSKFLAGGLRSDVIAGVGLNLVHVPSTEPDTLDLSSPILAQRSFLHYSHIYTKPSLRSVALSWGAGFHGCNMRFV